MKIRNLVLIFTTLFAVVGCFKDKGNYDYPEFPAISIKVGYMPDIISGETATFKSTITLPDGYETEFSYEWTVGTKLKATTEVFEFVGEEVGLFTVGVVATDKKTGMRYFTKSTIRVGSLFRKGFLILAEDGENTEMHFLRANLKMGSYADKTNDTLIFAGEYLNIYKDIIKEQIPGKPVSINEHWAWESPEIGEITVHTIVEGKDKFFEYNGTTMKRETAIEQEFSEEVLPANFAPKQVTHSCWDSFILNADGFIYPRRSSSSIAFHTGRFEKDIKLWGNSKFSDLLFSFYRYSKMFLALEIDPVTKNRNFVGIYENIGSIWSFESMSSKRLPQKPENSEFMNFKGEILFDDYFRGSSSDPSMNALIVKNELGQYILQVIEFSPVGKNNVNFTRSTKVNLTTDHSLATVRGMFTIKTFTDRVVYFYDDHTLYFYNYLSGDLGVVANYADKEIVAACAQSNVKRNGGEEDVTKQEAHIAIGFSDGTLEVQQLHQMNATKFDKKVYESKANFGKIKQIIYKLGDSTEFSDN